MKTYKYLLVAGLLCAMSQPLWADDNLYKQALEAYQKKDYKQANRIIDQFIQANPDNPNGHEAKAMILANMNYYVKALDQLRQVLELSPKNHRAAESYGAVLQRAINYLTKNGKFDKAVELAQQSEGAIPEYTATNKGQAAASYACGIAYFERWCQNDDPADYQQYKEHMKKVCDLDPVSPTGEIMTGATCYTNGDYNNALRHFQVAKTLRSSNPTAAMWTGLAYAALGSYDLALSELGTAKKMYSSNPNIAASIGDVLLAKGDIENAKLEYMAARMLKPTNDDLHYAVSDLHLLSGTAAEGIATLQAEISENPNFQSFYHLALMQLQMGDYAAATAACQRGVALASSPEQRAESNVLGCLIAFAQNPTQTQLRLSKNDADMLAQREDTAYWVYMSYIDPAAPQRELFARKALRVVAPNSRWIHAQAFKSLSLSTQDNGQLVWALEAINQAWQRTPQNSQALSGLQTRFNELAKLAADSLQKEINRESKNKGAQADTRVAQLQAQLFAVQNASLGNPGTRLLPSMSVPESASMVIPADTDPSLANLSNAYSEPIRWMVCKDAPEG